MHNSSISRMLRIQSRLRVSRDRYFVVAAILSICSLGVLFKLGNDLLFRESVSGTGLQVVLLFLACLAGTYFSYTAGNRCRAQMAGETRRWQDRIETAKQQE